MSGPIASGGWGYITDGSRAAMASAGLGSLFLVFDMYHGKTPFSRKNHQTFTEGDAAEVHKAIERGLDWLGKSKENKADGCYLYGIERAGVASGCKLVGGAEGRSSSTDLAVASQAARRSAESIGVRSNRRGKW